MTDISFLSAAEWLPDPILLVTGDGTVRGANRAGRLLLWGSEVAPPNGASLLAAVHGDGEAVVQQLRAGARSRQPVPGAMLLRGTDGAPRRYRYSVRLVEPSTAETPSVLLLHVQGQDGTSTQFKELNDRLEQLNSALRREREAEAERRKLEAQMLQTQKLESLGVLAGGIAHDFNNLLTSVIGYCDLACGEVKPNSAAREFLEEAVTGARRAAELTQQMLAYSGKSTLTKGPIQLSALVVDITRLLEVSISKKCVLRYNLLENMPMCVGDVTQLRQVIMNLIINASDAIGDRSGVIALTTGVAWCDSSYLAENFLDDDLSEGLYVHLEVADTGSGMSAETRQRIFDPFFTTKFAGRGLGLAAVLGIVRAHGGAIRVYSELGRGTTFKLLLPAAAQLDQQPEASAMEPAAWRGTGSVLVVDDEESIRGIARHMLTKMGFEVATASDGQEGVELFRRMAAVNPLVLLDLTMPHLDGAAAFAQLRRIRADVRVILMSGYSEHSIAERFAGKGPLGFIQKPFRLNELRELVRSTMEQ